MWGPVWEVLRAPGQVPRAGDQPLGRAAVPVAAVVGGPGRPSRSYAGAPVRGVPLPGPSREGWARQGRLPSLVLRPLAWAPASGRSGGGGSGRVGEGAASAHAPVGAASCPGRPGRPRQEEPEGSRLRGDPSRAGRCIWAQARMGARAAAGPLRDPQRTADSAAAGSAGPEGLACRGAGPPRVSKACVLGELWRRSVPAVPPRRSRVPSWASWCAPLRRDAAEPIVPAGRGRV